MTTRAYWKCGYKEGSERVNSVSASVSVLAQRAESVSGRCNTEDEANRGFYNSRV